MNFSYEAFGTSLALNSIRRNWSLAKTQFEKFWEHIRRDAIELRLRHNFKLSSVIFDKLPSNFYLRHNLDVFSKIFNRLQFNFGWRTYWNCLRIFPNVTNEFWLGQILWRSQKLFERMRLNFVYKAVWNLGKYRIICNWILAKDTNWESFGLFSIRCNWISAETQMGFVPEFFR